MEEDPNHPEKYFPPVEDEESGQKLLQFLERRLNLPQNLLHRWVRTGQIRLNGKRCKPFVRLNTGDLVRLPPFANKLAEQAKDEIPSEHGKLPPLVGEWKNIAAYNKPAGLPVQPGTDHGDSLSSRLHASHADSFYKPTPAHRLDKDTSGVILVGNTFEALKSIQEMLKEGKIHKEYLAWVEGSWPCDSPVILRHFLRKEGEKGKVKVYARHQEVHYSKEAVCIVNRIMEMDGLSLLHVRLFTGRTHQIRAQLAASGYPIYGDAKYGNGGGKLLLHAMRVILPDGHEFCCPPDWEDRFNTDSLPPPLFMGKSLKDISLPDKC